MIPLLIVSKDKKLIRNYVDDLKAGNLFFEIIPSLREFSIDDIKNLIKETKIFNQKTRVYFLEDFNNSSIPAQNSFLKLLEEPPSNVQFVLSSDNRNNLLPTIVSRVKLIKIDSKKNTVGVDKFVTEEIQKLLVPSTTKIPFLAFKITDNETAKNIFLQIISIFQARLITDKKATIVIKKILTLNKLLITNNLNPQLTIDEALIFIWKTYRIK